MRYDSIVIAAQFFSYIQYNIGIVEGISAHTGHPSLDDLVKVYCPSDKPYICLPYGVCCAGHEFCYSGNCESCFPGSIPQDEALLAWCKKAGQYNVSLMRHDSCSLACQAKFNSSVLSPNYDQITQCETNISTLNEQLLQLANIKHEKDTFITGSLGNVESGVIGGIIGALVAAIFCLLVANRQSIGAGADQTITNLQNNCCEHQDGQGKPPSKDIEENGDAESTTPMLENNTGLSKDLCTVPMEGANNEQSEPSGELQAEESGVVMRIISDEDPVPVNISKNTSLNSSGRI